MLGIGDELIFRADGQRLKAAATWPKDRVGWADQNGERLGELERQLGAKVGTLRIVGPPRGDLRRHFGFHLRLLDDQCRREVAAAGVIGQYRIGGPAGGQSERERRQQAS